MKSTRCATGIDASTAHSSPVSPPHKLPGRDTCTAAMRVGLWVLCGALGACGGNFEPPGVATGIGADLSARAASLEALREVRARPVGGSANTAAAAIGPGVLLDGLPGAYAYAALRGHVEESAAATSPSYEPSASARLHLNAVIAQTATVGQVNAALNDLGARIVAMQPGNSEVMLDVATPGGRPAASQVAARLVASRAFESVEGLRSAFDPATAAASPQLGDLYAPAPVEDHQSPP